jgi:uncharacterized membrane protein HdeD (DUF308 family)
MALDEITIGSVAALIATLYGIGFFVDSKEKRIMNAFWQWVAAQCLLLGSIVVLPFHVQSAALVLIVGILVMISTILKIAYEITRKDKTEKEGRSRIDAVLKRVAG